MSLTSKLRLLGGPEKASLLRDITRGIEKESLRVQSNGQLATTAHQKALGSALTHPSITTDYSEALLEFITAPSSSIDEVLNQLDEIHRFTYRHIDDELLWVSSMPCQLRDNSSIPIAEYGTSNIGTIKSVYRVGLGNRYGRLMQTIAGIHYNFSIPDAMWSELQAASTDNGSLQDFKTVGYFSLIRNFRRYSWLLLYLLGSAPAVCKSFVQGRAHRLVPMGNDTHSLHTPYATSLRMGDLGYQSDAQESLVVCYNSMAQYIKTLQEALEQPHPAYDEIGLKDADGHYRQLNTHLLQIENEFYSAIRPKRTSASGERPLQVLEQRGVEYIEVRCVDLNPNIPGGIDAETIRFLDTFLMFCLLQDSPESDCQEYAQIQENISRTVYRGRDPKTTLISGGEEVLARELGNALLFEMQPVANLLDSANQTEFYNESLETMQLRMRDDSYTPAASLLQEMTDNNETYYAMAMRKACEQREHYLERPPSKETIDKYEQLAVISIQQQADLEASDELSFDEFLARY